MDRHPALKEKVFFLLMAICALSLAWKMLPGSGGARLETIIFPIEESRYVVDYGREAGNRAAEAKGGVHARVLALQGDIGGIAFGGKRVFDIGLESF